VESLDVTPHHIFAVSDGSPMRAERICLSEVFAGRFGRITLKRIEGIVVRGEGKYERRVSARCEPTRQFFAGDLAATILTQNYTCSS